MDAEDKEVGRDAEDKEIGRDAEDKETGRDTKDKETGRDTEDKEIGRDTEDREIGRDTEDREIGRDTEDREIGRDTKDKEIGRDTGKEEKIDTEGEMRKEEKKGEMSAEEYYELGVAYEHGQGAHMDLGKAKECFKKCIEKGGTAGAYNNLGYIYQHNEANVSKAKKYYQKALDMGCPSGYNNLGYLYWQGAENIPRDPERALEYFVRAIELGVGEAHLNLCDMMEEELPSDFIKKIIPHYWQRVVDGKDAGSIFFEFIEPMIRRHHHFTFFMDHLRQQMATLQHTVTSLLLKNKELTHENDLLHTQLSFQPGGVGFLSTKEHFESLQHSQERSKEEGKAEELEEEGKI